MHASARARRRLRTFVVAAAWCCAPAVTPAVEALESAELAALLAIRDQTGGSGWEAHTAGDGFTWAPKQWGIGDPCGGGEVKESAVKKLFGNDAAYDDPQPFTWGWGARPDLDDTGAVICDAAKQHVLSVSLDSTNLAGAFPTAVCRLPKLRVLDLSGNKLAGPIPVCLGSLDALRTIAAPRNALSGGLDHLCSNAALDTIDLGDNRFTGPIPQCFGTALPVLTSFKADKNKFSGDLVATVCGAAGGDIEPGSQDTNPTIFPKLNALNLDNNEGFAPGPVPPCLCEHREQLESIRLIKTRRTGVIPPCLGNITQLQNLSLGQNPSLSGTIPTELCKLQNLQGLFLHETTIAGSIPSCVGELTKLGYLFLTELALTGAVPTSLVELPVLKILIMSSARFTGGIPGANLGCSSSDPNAGHPGETCRQAAMLQSIQLLAMTDCGLTGPIPSWLGGLETLTALELSGNALTGPLPNVSNTSMLMAITIRNNQISGSLAPLRNISATLTHLDISDNKIGGAVPGWLANRSGEMGRLAAKGNHLSCNLPGDTAISDGGALDLLDGNLFGCPVPADVLAADRIGTEYSCGSRKALAPGVLFGVLIAMMLGLFVWHSASDSDSERSTNFNRGHTTMGPRDIGWMLLHPSSDAELSSLLLRCTVAVAVLWLAVLAPLYALMPSELECRYAWRVALVSLLPATAAANNGSGMVHINAYMVLALVSATGASGMLVYFVVQPGVQKGCVSIGSVGGGIAGTKKSMLLQEYGDDEGAGTGATTADDDDDDGNLSVAFGKLRGHHGSDSGILAQGFAILLIIALLVFVVGINVGFVILEESSSGKLSPFEKTMLTAGFALIHNVIAHVAGPVVLQKIVVLLGLSHVNAVFRAVMLYGLTNAVVAPLIGFLFASSGCYRDKILSSPSAVTTQSQIVDACQVQNRTGGCAVYGNNTVGVAFTPAFVFDGRKCTEAIVLLLTPAYLWIFTVRVLLLLPSWYLARRAGKPWLLAGATPTRFLQTTFVKVRSMCGGERAETEEEHGSGNGRHDRDHDHGRDFANNAGNADDDVGFDAGAARGEVGPVLAMLHAVESESYVAICLAIGLCAGMLSPVVALAAAMTVLIRPALFKVLEKKIGKPPRDADATRSLQLEDPEAGSSPRAGLLPGAASGAEAGVGAAEHRRTDAYTEVIELPQYPIPADCIFMLVLFHSIYLVLILAAAKVPPAWCVATVALEWAGFWFGTWRVRKAERDRQLAVAVEYAGPGDDDDAT